MIFLVGVLGRRIILAISPVSWRPKFWHWLVWTLIYIHPFETNSDWMPYQGYLLAQNVTPNDRNKEDGLESTYLPTWTGLTLSPFPHGYQRCRIWVSFLNSVHDSTTSWSVIWGILAHLSFFRLLFFLWSEINLEPNSQGCSGD